MSSLESSALPTPPFYLTPPPPPWQPTWCSTLVHGGLLFAAGEGTGVRDPGGSCWSVGAPLGGDVTRLSEEVVEGVTQIGNVMLVKGPVLLLCLSQTLHQFYNREGAMLSSQRRKGPQLTIPGSAPPTAEVHTPGQLCLQQKSTSVRAPRVQTPILFVP